MTTYSSPVTVNDAVSDLYNSQPAPVILSPAQGTHAALDSSFYHCEPSLIHDICYQDR